MTALALAQWPVDLNEQLCRERSRIMENGGDDQFIGLYDGDRRISAKMTYTKFGTQWLLTDVEAERYGRKFLPVGPKSRLMQQLGLREAFEMAPAWAKIEGAGRGPDAIAWVQVYRTGDKWGSDATLCA